ncbi:MAG: elongation factor G [Bacteroidia bacterium]
MKVYQTHEIKNIVLLGAPKSGKSTLAETMLFEGGVSKRRGTIEDGNTLSDYHEIEKERKNSIFSSVLHTEWRGQKINIIDTPGFDDFIGDIVSGLRVADTGVMVLNAAQGVEVGTDILWHHAERYNLPIIFAINQMDHEKADFETTLEQARTHYGSKVVAMQYPYNSGNGFDSIIDLLKMTMYKFRQDGGKPEKLDIPEEEREKANELHNTLVEAAAENDDKLLELYFEKGELNEDEMRAGLKAGIINRQVFPVFCMSAKNNMGSGRMMGFIDNVAPNAAEMPAPKTVDDQEIECGTSGPGTLFIFKTAIESHSGTVSYFKVVCGDVKPGDEFVNPRTSNSEKINQLFVMDGKNRNPVDKLMAGDIGATVKLKEARTNDTLTQKGKDIQLKPIQFPTPRMRTAIEAKDKNMEEKMAEALHNIQIEDPTLIVDYSSELRQTILNAQGELHLAITRWRLENEHKIEIEFIRPRIPYRETIQKRTESHYRHKKQSGGAGQFAEVNMFIMPYEEGMEDPAGHPIRGREEHELPWGGKLVFYNCIVGGVIDNRFLPSIVKGIMEKMQQGPLTGSYVRDIVVGVYDGKMHAVDSNDMAFKIAGMQAFRAAFHQADPKLLEPVYDVEVLAPEDVTGEIMTDLQGRRAIIMGIDSEGSYQKIKAKVPLAELYKYSTSLRSLSQGRASHSRKFAEYSPVPADLQQKLTLEYKDEEAVGV